MGTTVVKMKLGVLWKKRQRALEVTELVLLDALLVRGRHAVPGLDYLVPSWSWFVIARILRPYLVQNKSCSAPVLGRILEPQSAPIVEVHHESLGSGRRVLLWRPGLKRQLRRDVGVQQCAPRLDPVLVVANLLVSRADEKPIQLSPCIENRDRSA